MKKKLMTFAFGLSCVMSVSGQERLDELEKELSIMATVIEKGLEPESNDGVKVHEVSARYFANQGVTFEVKTNLKRNSIFYVTNELSQVDQIWTDSSNLTIEFLEEGLGDIISSAFEVASEAIENSTHASFDDLSDKQRELAWEKRELLRRKRDVEYERRLAEQGNEEDYLNDISEIEAELEALSAKEEQLKKFAKEIKSDKELQRTNRVRAFEKKQASFISFFENEVSKLLCSFGSGINSLEETEFVNFVLPSFDHDGKDVKDRIYVFKYANIASCKKNKNGADTLLKAAQVYSF